MSFLFGGGVSKAPGRPQQRQCGLGCPGKASGAESKQRQRFLLTGGKANTLFPKEQQLRAVSIAFESCFQPDLSQPPLAGGKALGKTE